MTTARAPTSQSPLFAVCYDISNNRERRRVSELLQGFGFRAQKSVFECRMSKAQKQQLLGAIERLTLRTGEVRMYRVYADSGVRRLGSKKVLPDEAHAFCV